MIRLESILVFYFLFLPSSILLGQTFTYYVAYQSSFPLVASCQNNQYYDTALLQCAPCPDNAVQKSSDITQCECRNNTYYYSVNQGGGSLICVLCPTSTGSVRSTDGFGCTVDVTTCDNSLFSRVSTESNLDGSLTNSNPSASVRRDATETCVDCVSGTWSDPSNQRCTPCASVTPRTGSQPNQTVCCTTGSTNYRGGICLTNIINGTGISFSANYNNRYSNPSISVFFSEHLDTAVYLCRMNLNSINATSSSRTLLSNVTACQVLANIAAMQFYYPGLNYAFTLYRTYIWQLAQQIYGSSSVPPAIPFLAYPSTYYSEITNSSYNWIPASFNQNGIIRIKLAKYSPRGQYLGLFDALDSYLQLCGGGYTTGRPAFTFGTQFNKTCKVRVDALYNSTLYETAFFDPYIVFTVSGIDRMLPAPVVIKNYRTERDAMPNQIDNPSSWVYHRRFFLLDRISGFARNNELSNVHYATSIKILNTLSPGGLYIQPPVIMVEYDELSTSDLGRGMTVEINFETQYTMNLDSHIRDIWIAIGVLSGLGIIFAMIETSVWQTQAGKQIIDLGTIGKLLLYIINAIGTVFFIVMAGVSLWWLIFFKRQDLVYLVIPTSLQQASFTSLVVIAFVLKTLDILHLIIRQSNIDIFFMDWEKPRTGDPNSVSVWRSYLVANEYSELQVFRRINVTFQLIFVLFLLKVINLENVASAQPNTNLFPSSADYQAAYNGILRVGIAFSMWLATALLQFLAYIIFYQRFVEDKILNFIDLCSLCNISVFILKDDQYGYYIHGRSPTGTTDVNMKDMRDRLKREVEQQIGGRGLEPNSEEQTFIIQVDRAFRLQYQILLRTYQNRILTHMTKKGEEHESNILLESYQTLNEFLCKFLDHALPTYSYAVRNRVFFEKILNCEFRGRNRLGASGDIESTFYNDPDRNFTRTFFCGYENSLFIWNMATFLFIDYFASNYVLAAILTYLLNLIVIKMRVSLGQRNLSKKTLIPRNFLI